MDDLFRKIWTIIDDDVKLEIISYLVLQAQNEQRKWNLRPQTRDGSRDVEGKDEYGTYFCEAKYRTSKKLTLKDVGDDIANAILKRIQILWITTNNEIRNDLEIYVEKFNQAQKDILLKRLNIELISGRILERLILKENTGKLRQYIDQIIVKGYIGIDKHLRTKDTEDKYIAIGIDIIENIHKLKNIYKNNFICNPTIENFKKNHTENSFDFFQITFFYSCNKEFAIDGNPVSIYLGTNFSLHIIIRNIFDDDIEYKIEIDTDVAVNILMDYTTDGNKIVINKSICRSSFSATEIICKVNTVPQYFNINIIADDIYINNTHSLNCKSFLNRLFHVPFYTTNEQAMINDLFIRHVKSVAKNRMHCSIIKGRAGVGKSEIIKAFFEHIYKQNYENTHVLHYSLSQHEIKYIIQNVIIQTLGLDIFEKSIYEKNTIYIIREILFSVPFTCDDKKLNDLKNICNKIFNLRHQSEFLKDEINEIAFLLFLLLKNYSRRKNIIFAIEDIHLASKTTFELLSRLINELSSNNVSCHLIFAERIEDYINNHFIKLFYDSIKAPIIYVLDDLDRDDAHNLIKHYITCDNEEVCAEMLVRRIGRNPFSIVQSLNALFCQGIIYEQNNKLHTKETKINSILNFHNVFEIDNILSKRFLYFLSAKDSIYKDTLIYILLFRNCGPIECLRKLLNKPEIILRKMIQFFLTNRMLIYNGQFMSFEHENLYLFFASNIYKLIEGSYLEEKAKQAYLYIKNKTIFNKFELEINFLYYCNISLSKKFSAKCFNYINKLRVAENWTQIIYYCDLYLEKNKIPFTMKEFYDIFNIRYIKYDIEKEFSSIINTLNNFENLVEEIEKYFMIYRKTTRFDWLNLQIKAIISLASVYQQCNEGKNAVKFMQKSIELIEQGNRIEFIAHAYNRLGVSYKLCNDISSALKNLKISLKSAFKNKDTLFIHHNYFDIASCFLQLGNISVAKKYHLKGEKYINQNYKVQWIRSRIKTFTLFLLSEESIPVEELKGIIEYARINNYRWEYCRANNLYGIILIKNKEYKKAVYFLRDAVDYVNQHNKSEVLSLCIINNLIISLFCIDRNDINIKGLISQLNSILIKERNKLNDKIMPPRLNGVVHNLSILAPHLCDELKDYTYPIEESISVFHQHEDLSFFLVYR